MAICTAVQRADLDQYAFLEAKLRSSPAGKLDVLKGLMCSKDHWRLKKYFANDFDYSSAVLKNMGVNTNPNGNAIIWDFIKSNWNELADLNEQLSLAELVFEVAKNFNTPDKYDEYKRFLEDKKIFFKDENSLKILRLAQAEIRLNVKWLHTVESSIGPEIEKISKSFVIKADNKEKKNSKEGSHRLPKSLLPYFYDIQIRPYIGNLVLHK